MLCSQEWGDRCPHEFLGAYKLEYDMSWTPYEEISSKSVALNKMMGAVTQHIQPSSHNSVDSQTSTSAKNILALADA